MGRILLALLFATGMASPALAQAECDAQANEVWMTVQGSDLPEEQKEEVATVLEEATAHGAAGDEAACLDIIGQVRQALGWNDEATE